MDEQPTAKTPSWKIAAVALAVIGLLAAARFFNVQLLLRDAVEWIAGLGLIGPLVFTLLYILACVLFVPGSLLTLGAGFVWGVGWGTVLISVASTLGASAAFIVGRYFAREMVAKKIEGKVDCIYSVGDCAKPRKIIDAIYEGFRAALTI